MGKIRQILTFLCFSSLLGCGTTEPDDLRFESIETVKLSELPSVWKAVQGRTDARTNSITLLRVYFSSRVDFVKLAKASTLQLSYRAFTCRSGNLEGSQLFVLPDLRTMNYSAGSGVYSELPDLEQFRNPDGRLTYHVLIPIGGDELNRLFGSATGRKQPLFFDADGPDVDICLRVVAAAMWFGPTFQSNVVRVRANDVARLLN